MSKNVEKIPLTGRTKVAFMFLLSGKKTEGASNQNLQNLECGAYGLCRTDLHQNLPYCNWSKTTQPVEIQFKTNEIQHFSILGAGNFWKFLSQGSQQQTLSAG